MQPVVKEISAESVAVVFFVDDFFFRNESAKNHIREHMANISKKLGKVCVAMPIGADVKELSDVDLKDLGLIRADFGDKDEQSLP